MKRVTPHTRILYLRARAGYHHIFLFPHQDNIFHLMEKFNVTEQSKDVEIIYAVYGGGNSDAGKFDIINRSIR